MHTGHVAIQVHVGIRVPGHLGMHTNCMHTWALRNMKITNHHEHESRFRPTIVCMCNCMHTIVLGWYPGMHTGTRVWMPVFHGMHTIVPDPGHPDNIVGAFLGCRRLPGTAGTGYPQAPYNCNLRLSKRTYLFSMKLLRWLRSSKQIHCICFRENTFHPVQ